MWHVQILLKESLRHCEVAVWTPVALSCGPRSPFFFFPCFLTSLPCTPQLLSGNASHAPLSQSVDCSPYGSIKTSCCTKNNFWHSDKVLPNEDRKGRDMKLFGNVCGVLGSQTGSWGCLFCLQHCLLIPPAITHLSVLVRADQGHGNLHFYVSGLLPPSPFPPISLLPSVSVFKDLLAEGGRWMRGTSPRIYKKLLAGRKSLSLSSTLMKRKQNIVAHFWFLILKCFAPPTTRFRWNGTENKLID